MYVDLRRVMKAVTVLLCPTRDRHRPLVQHAHAAGAPPGSHLEAVSGVRSTGTISQHCVRVTLVSLSDATFAALLLQCVLSLLNRIISSC